MIKEVIIIGAGPGGLSCASYLQRLGICSTVIYQTFGGKQNYYRHIYGLYPSSRTTTADFLKDQRAAFECVLSADGVAAGVTEVNASVNSVSRDNDGVFRVGIENGAVYSSTVVVLATGTRVEVPTSIAALDENFLTFKDYPYNSLNPSDRILILGAGYTAAEAVAVIASKVASIQIVDVSDENHLLLGPDRKSLFDDSRNVELAFDSSYVLTKNKVTFKRDGEAIDYVFDKVVLCTGEKPNTDLLSEHLLDPVTRKVRLRTHPSSYEVNMSSEWEGLYVIGDLKNEHLTSYISYAAADGMRTAQSVQRYIRIKNGVPNSQLDPLAE